MSIQLFKTLIAVADLGSFAAAADRVCVSHAAVGQQMRRLEDQLQVALFDRSQKTPRLNQLGRALVPKARDIVQAYDTILDDLTGDAALIGELSLGAVPSVIRELVPASIKRLIQTYPHLHVRVVPGLTADLQDQVERGAVDAAILSRPAYVGSNLRWQPFAEEEFVLLTSPDVALDDPAEILATMPYIRHARRSAVGQLVEEWLARNQITVSETMEMGSLENLTSMVSHNLGVSIVPDLCVPDPIFAQLRKIQLGPGRTSRSLGMLTRLDCSKIHLADRLLDQVQATVADYRADPVS